ncbi:MAG: hypothetical protein H6Q12_215 [Bacteroidetes bacterium]|nr:hypothetical protein [Bacteroidota bacterium]
MKKIFIYSFCALFLVSCGNQENADTVGFSTPLTVGSVSISTPHTKATTTQTSGSIGVYCQALNGYTAQNNVQYTYSGGIWSKVSSDIILRTAGATLRACYPYDASYTTPSAIPLTSQLYTAAKDLCYSSAVTASFASPVAAFTGMSRAYARVTFNITHSATYPGNCNITGLSIANAGIKTASTLDITSGTYATGTAGIFSCNPGITIASGATSAIDLLMVPVTTAMSGSLALTFIVDGSTMPASLVLSTYGLTTLDPGKQYVINLTVRESTLAVTTVNVTDWADASTNAGTIYKQ